MANDAYSHGTQQERKFRVGWLSYVIWFASIIMSGAAFMAIGVFGLTSLVLSALGVPIPDRGLPHEIIHRAWEHRRQWRRDQGVSMAASFSRNDDDEPGKIERIQFVNARVQEKVKATGEVADNFLPVLTTEERDTATLVLTLPGASDVWLKQDPYGKYMADLLWFESLSQALGVSSVPRLEVAMTRFQRPYNRELGLTHARRRGSREILGTRDGDDTVNGRLANNLAERLDRVGDRASSPQEITTVMTDWPVKAMRKIGLDSASAFRGSPLYKTTTEVLRAYKNANIEGVRMLSAEQLQQLWDYVWRIRDADQFHMLEGQLRAMSPTNDPETTTPGQLNLDKGVSIRPSPPGGGYLDYNGTFFVAGYVKSFLLPQVRPGHRRGIVLPNDIYWAATTYIETALREKETKSARERERRAMMSEGLNPLEKGLSDPGGGERRQQAIEWRQRLRETGNRTARYWLLHSVGADSVEEAENRWDDYVIELARNGYVIERLYDPDDIEDVLVAQWGIRMDR